MNDELDTVETLLASFVCADAAEQEIGGLSGYAPPRTPSQHDAGSLLPFNPAVPTTAYIPEITSEREYALDADLLLSPVQDLIGAHAEIAMIDEVGECIKWSAFRRLHKRPRNLFVSQAGADLYEFHFRRITPDGSSSYNKGVAAISKHGKPVQTIIQGTRDSYSRVDGEMLILGASIIEDACNRPGAILATIRESVGVKLPIPQGAHLDIFKLRDGPMTGNRRRPLLHFVAGHLRRAKTEPVAVREHFRGVSKFVIDGFDVELRANDAAAKEVA